MRKMSAMSRATEVVNKATKVKNKLAVKIFMPKALYEKIIWEENPDEFNKITKSNTTREIVSSLVFYFALSAPLLFPDFYIREADNNVFLSMIVSTVVIAAFGIFVFIQATVINRVIRTRRTEIVKNRTAKSKEARLSK